VSVKAARLCCPVNIKVLYISTPKKKKGDHKTNLRRKNSISP